VLLVFPLLTNDIWATRHVRFLGSKYTSECVCLKALGRKRILCN